MEKTSSLINLFDQAREGGFIPGLHVPDASQSSRMQHGSNFKIGNNAVVEFEGSNPNSTNQDWNANNTLYL